MLIYNIELFLCYIAKETQEICRDGSQSSQTCSIYSITYVYYPIWNSNDVLLCLKKVDTTESKLESTKTMNWKSIKCKDAYKILVYADILMMMTIRWDESLPVPMLYRFPQMRMNSSSTRSEFLTNAIRAQGLTHNMWNPYNRTVDLIAKDWGVEYEYDRNSMWSACQLVFFLYFCLKCYQRSY